MAEWKKKKAKTTNWGDFYRSEKEFEAMKWCINHGITIGPLAADKGSTNPNNFYIDIKIQGKVNRSPQTFKAQEVWSQIYKYYLHYYEKYRDRLS